MFGENKNKKIKELETLVDDMQRLCSQSLKLLTDYLIGYGRTRIKYARFFGMIERGIPFLVVKWEEPYADIVYNMIRESETKAGRWTEIDEKVYHSFCTFSGKTRKEI